MGGSGLSLLNKLFNKLIRVKKIAGLEEMHHGSSLQEQGRYSDLYHYHELLMSHTMKLCKRMIEQ